MVKISIEIDIDNRLLLRMAKFPDMDWKRSMSYGAISQLKKSLENLEMSEKMINNPMGFIKEQGIKDDFSNLDPVALKKIKVDILWLII